MRHFKRQPSGLVLPTCEVSKLPAEYPAIVRMMLILSHEILELKEIL